MNTVYRIIICGVALAFLWALPVSASEPDAGFSVRAVLPENQRDAGVAYFDLAIAPGEEQDLVVLVQNPNQEPIQVAVETVTPSTNRNGIIQYGGPGLYDETMPFLFSQISQPEESVLTVEPFSTAEAVVTVSMPEESFEGLLLGSICFVKALSEEELAGDGVVNQYSYVIGVRLYGKAPHERTQPQFGLGNVYTELVNYKASIVAPVRNPTPSIQEGIGVAAAVFQEGSDTPIIEKSQVDIEMAPHSIFPMTLTDQEGYGFPPGNYTAQVRLTQGEESWTFTQAFSVLPQEAEALNAGAVNQTQAAPSQTVPNRVAPFALLFALAAAIALGFWRLRTHG